MENELRFMEHTEKLVAEVLKSVLASDHEDEIEVDDNVEYVIIDENGAGSPNSLSNATHIGATVLNMNEDALGIPLINIARESNCEEDIQFLISEGLEKIRLEYPMYEAFQPHNYNNWHHSSVSNAPATTAFTEKCSQNSNTLHNAYYLEPNTINHSDCSSVYQDGVNDTVYNNEYWENIPYGDSENTFEQTSSTASLSNSRNTTAEDMNFKVDFKSSAENVKKTPTIEELSEDDDTFDFPKREANVLPNKPSGHFLTTSASRCNDIPDELIEAGISQLNINNNINTTTGVSTATSAAIHAEKRTTSATFGVLHQQTSFTTTNFIPNNLANAALTTTPAALYAQSILASTAHQYLNVFHKEIQLYNAFNNIASYNASASNYHFGIYERLFYAQLLQQQLFQQQQQAAIATVLLQQKIAIQKNVKNVAVSNTTSPLVGNVGIRMSENDCGCSTTLFKGDEPNNVTEVVGNNNPTDMSKNQHWSSKTIPVNDDCLGSVNKSVIE